MNVFKFVCDINLSIFYLFFFLIQKLFHSIFWDLPKILNNLTDLYFFLFLPFLHAVVCVRVKFIFKILDIQGKIFLSVGRAMWNCFSVLFFSLLKTRLVCHKHFFTQWPFLMYLAAKNASTIYCGFLKWKNTHLIYQHCWSYKLNEAF